MASKSIERRCEKKAQELLDKYFGNILKEAAVEQPETIGDYSMDLPLKIADEYKTFLEVLWKTEAPESLKGTPLLLEEQKLRELSTEGIREYVDQAYRDATHSTLWERLTQTNHKDVAHYKALLRRYTQELLKLMQTDFMEEINGQHISTKTFEED